MLSNSLNRNGIGIRYPLHLRFGSLVRSRYAILTSELIPFHNGPWPVIGLVRGVDFLFALEATKIKAFFRISLTFMCPNTFLSGKGSYLPLISRDEREGSMKNY